MTDGKERAAMMKLLAAMGPQATDATRAAIADGLLTHAAAHGVTSTLRLAHFLAQVAHESAGFSRMVENLNYSANRLRQVWPSRFTDELAMRAAGNPERIANIVYANRLGNGGAASGDGWRYRGRGLIQITGRNNYLRYGQMIGANLAGDPDAAADPATAVRIALAYWQSNGLNEVADADNIEAITQRINGGQHGIDDRRLRLAAAKRALGVK